MSHFRGIRAQRMTAPRNGAELDLGPWPLPDFPDTEQVEPGTTVECEEHDSGWSGPGGCFPGYPTNRSKT